MTTHWRPLGSAKLRVQDTKAVFGHQAYRFDARCDLCYWSGPFDCFEEFTRGDETIQVCPMCFRAEGDSGDLAADGWQMVEELPF